MIIFWAEESVSILYKLIISLSILVLAACTSDDEPVHKAVVTGNEVYKRHLAKGDNVVMDCYVYATENSVAVDMSLDLIAYDHSTMTMTMVTEVGDPLWYTADITLSGVLLSEYEETCESVKSQFEGTDAEVRCSNSNIHSQIELPGITNPVKLQLMIEDAIEESKGKCDDLFNQYRSNFSEFDGAWDFGEPVEAAQSCEVNMANDTVYLNVAYLDKAVTMKTTMADASTFSTTEEYVGLDDATLVEICNAHKDDDDIYSYSVGCNGPWYVYSHPATINGTAMTLEDLAVSMKKELCPGFLNGSYTLEDLWK